MPSSEQPLIYYSSLELENVRCFGERQTLELTDEKGRPAQWTLLLGDNGVGKTTLLQCLAWMRPVPAGAQNDAEPQAIEPALANEENRVFNSLLRAGDEVSLDLKASLSINQKLGPAKAQRRRQKITTGISIQGKRQRLEDFKQELKKIPRHLHSLDMPIFAYGADRRMGSSNLEKSELLDPLASLFSGSTELYDAEERLLQLDYLAVKREERHKDRLEQVKQILSAILPDISGKNDIEILGPKSGVPDEESGVKFHTPYGWVPLTGLSLGYQTTLAWAIDLAWRLYDRFPESSNSLAEPAIVLIDEIDLHLHPRWQRQIIANLTQSFPNTQFIATAHSPLIVQAATDANLVVLQEQTGQKERKSQIKIENRPRFIKSWRADQILTSDLFGVPTRSPHIESLMDEWDRLLDKPEPNTSDKKRLRELEEKLDNLPTAERYEDQEAMDIIRKAAALLQQ